ncbi:type I restriction endonuclease subunit R [Actinomyces faecalis]|uniref:type I restriction endonuclease subunit R n=1 Tax=Actinomyces faecalis TaxID=2722820 RepID=UPI0015552F36|nr:type I restriction endonuclease [Actinomyces faecalis]
MGVEHEIAFETEICEYLATHGWIYDGPGDNGGYDKELGLYPADVLAWLEQTQSEEFAKIVQPDMSSAKQEAAKRAVLDRLVRSLDKPLEQGGGTLAVLRQGFRKAPARFSMCAFKPATSLNPLAWDHYQANRLRVVRQVYYSKLRPVDSIDLVLFVNGLPVATIELKTDDQQSIEDAVRQYRHDRDPKGERLLGFGNRCLVHFAVSTDEVRMTTKLAGSKTFFLPFNLGRDGGAGNPVNPNGAASSYLWERVLDRDAWLNILGSFLHLTIEQQVDPITGARSTSSKILFPRFHQWELVTSLLDTARCEGPGHRYLVQHSAGSGKTNSIAWLAHGLSKLHDDANHKVFDSVVVVTDRTVLDDQLQKAITSLEGTAGTVASINIDEARRAGETSKSALLAGSLLSGKQIVIVTMQTFPFVLDAIAQTQGLADRNFAIIADEAHSSQTGRVSQKLRAVLTTAEQEDVDDGGDVALEDVIAAEMSARADAPNLSFFAFTATPKAKTLELFGRRDSDGVPQAFHVYTMQQAIEEGFILDVLRNYTTYKTAFRVAESTKNPFADDDLVDESTATKGLMRWVSLHPTNIAQKVQIIIEHYRANVACLLDGHAKAMVVTASRVAAVKYKEAMDRYIRDHGYDLATLVAFSGSITAEQAPDVSFGYTEPPYTENTLNRGLRGRSLPNAFATDEYQVLIVANKYQTGFDQPLLCAMYVDKRLSGITAVQTLSRLNRTYPAAGKDTTYVLDFVNDPEEICKSFLPYYRTAEILQPTDPDLIYDIQAKLAVQAIYTDQEVENFAVAFLTKGTTHGAHTGPLKAAADRFNDRYIQAVQGKDKHRIDELDLFKKDVSSFVKTYDFLSQIIDYQDTMLEKLALFLRLLLPRLTGKKNVEELDFSSIELTHIKQARKADVTIDLNGGTSDKLKPVGVGSGGTHDPNLVEWNTIIERINSLFADEDFSPSAVESWVQGVVTILVEQEDIRQQANANTREQFRESRDLERAVEDAVVSHQEDQSKIMDYFFSSASQREEIIRQISDLVYSQLTREDHS